MNAEPLAQLRLAKVSTLTSEAVDVASSMRKAREKFIVGFQATFEMFEILLERSAADPSAARDLHRQAHRLAGLAGTVGFPTVSERASAIEEILDAGSQPGRLPAAMKALETIREAYTADLTSPPAWSSAALAREAVGLTVLVVDDDPEQRALLSNCLLEAGHAPIVRDSGIGLLECARVEQPSVILLDVNMPGVDGYGSCQLLKADPDTCGIPVVLMSTRGGLSDRLAGLSLGADDYLCKPIDVRELLLRLRLLSIRRETQEADTTWPEGQGTPLKYDTFIARARAQLARSSASVAVVRLPTYHADAAWNALREDTRRRDMVGWFDRSHLVLLCPEMSALDTRTRLSQIIQRLPPAVSKGMHAGVTFAPLATWAMEAVIAEADEALTQARCLGETAAVTGTGSPRDAPKHDITVLLADDDPDVSRLLDAHLQAAGYRTVLAFDGEDTLEAVETSRPDALVLDLMLPKITGFDVLQTLKQMPRKPPILVLSARSREDDVTRAFELGADDFMIKPFNPPELLTRLSRLLR